MKLKINLYTQIYIRYMPCCDSILYVQKLVKDVNNKGDMLDF